MHTETDSPETRIGRVEFTVMISMTMALAALAIDITLPSFGDIRDQFGLASDSNAVAPVITFALMGLAIGQLLWGPLSDALGRKVILYAGITTYILGTVGAAISPALGVLYASSFVIGIGASGARVVALSTVRDLYTGHRMAKVMSLILAIFLLVPLVAPSIGAAVRTASTWRYVYVFVGVAGVSVLLWTTRLPETLMPDRRIQLDLAKLGAAVGFVLRNRLTMGYTLAQAFVFGFFASYLASSELIIGDVFGLADWFPLIFSGFAAFLGAAILLNNHLLNRLDLRTMLRIAFGLYLAGGIVFALMAIFTGGSPPFAVFAVMLAPLLGVYALLLPNLNSAALIPMGSMAGTASAVIGMVSILGGSMIGSLIDRAFNGTITPFAVSAAITGILAFGFFVWADRAWDEEAVEIGPVP
ncbi:MAG: multidrug effflux MFS transporter [Acidimicrobiia bacterium]|nr:MAG: multidrug effflux MFS transporter [Acidimicrobiia bacterium]